MNVLWLKITLVLVMGVVAFVCGALPVKVYKILQRRSNKHSSLIISLLSCFAGGVILAVCLLDMLPDAHEDLNDLRDATGWKSNYPFLYLFIGVGFFLVYFLEEVIDHMCDHGHHTPDRQRRMTVAVLPSNQIHPESEHKLAVDYCSTNSDQPLPVRCDSDSSGCDREEEARERRKALVTAFTFVLALLIHTFLEGFAFGVTDTEISVMSLFFGIIVHKALVSFSVGMNLTEKLPDRPWIVFSLVGLLAVFSPLGAMIGMLIQNSGLNAVPKAIVSTLLTCFSIGCFFFITFFDILAVERKNQHNNLLQWVCCVAGFAAVALMLLLAGN